MGLIANGRWGSFGREKISEHFFRNTSYTPPTSLYVALGTGITNDLGGEVSGNGYSRLEINGATGRGLSVPATNDQIAASSNTTQWAWPVATSAGWGSINQIAIMDAASGTNTIASAQMSAITVNAGDIFVIDPGELEFRNEVDNAEINIGSTGPFWATVEEHFLRGNTQTPPDTNVWMGFLTADQSAASMNALRQGTYTSELTGSGYARVEVGNDLPGSGVGFIWDAINGWTEIDGNVKFTTATADWAGVWWLGVWDQSVSGKLLMFGALRVGNSDDPIISSALVVTKNSFFRLNFNQESTPNPWLFLIE